MFDTASPGSRRVLEILYLDARDELVTDAKLGQRLRSFFDTYDRTRAELLARPANVVVLTEWLEGAAQSGSLR